MIGSLLFHNDMNTIFYLIYRMSSNRIRTHPILLLLFRVSKVTGMDIPDINKEAEKPKLLTVWEVATFATALTTLCLVTSTILENNVSSLKIAKLSQPIAIFMIYFMVLTKTVNLLAKKRQLLDLFQKMDEIIAFQPFEKFQKPVVDLICSKIRMTFIFLICLSTCCILGGSAIFSSFFILMRSKSSQEGFSMTEQENITNALMQFTKYQNGVAQFAFSMHSIFNFVLPIKNIAMDSFMFLCHFFVVQQLNLLNRNFNKVKKNTPIKTFAGLQLDYENEDFENWLELFNKIRR